MGPRDFPTHAETDRILTACNIARNTAEAIALTVAAVAPDFVRESARRHQGKVWPVPITLNGQESFRLYVEHPCGADDFFYSFGDVDTAFDYAHDYAARHGYEVTPCA